MNIYDFKIKDVEQNEISIKDYKGKVLLIVNTATACGLTPQYEGLQAVYEKYKDKGFEILNFPCNQFLAQAPGTDEEILEFCQTKYNVTFKTFSKIDVNGENTDPLYVYLKKEAPADIEDAEAGFLQKKLADMGQIFKGEDIKWNFGKFLINREGNVVGRYSPTYKPEALDTEIAKLL